MRQHTRPWTIVDAIASAVRVSVAILACLLAAIPATAQKETDAQKALIQKAQALESRGRPDIAVQVWQQILLSDPNNQTALEGVARDYRLSGNSTASDEALEKLRRINPTNPNIGKIQGLTSTKSRDTRLSQAGALAKAGNPEAAMRIYHELYGDHPPDGDVALAYYETLYATPNGKSEAITGMRAAAARNPADTRYTVTLGRMLTYDPRTRAEGIRILHQHPESSDAQVALRQALVWDSANPASAAELQEYLKTHPNDTELAKRLQQNKAKLAEMNAGIARTPEEKAAFAALNAHKLGEAEARFQAMLNKDENNARAAAGMGFLRMQQNRFGDAISYLEQSMKNGFRDRSVVDGLATSRFWFTMGEASTAFDANQLRVASQKYQLALEMRPRSPDALNGLAGVYVKNQQYFQAASTYEQILKIQPNSVDAWRGLFLAKARDNRTQEALAVTARFPASVKTSLNRDPDFLQTLAGIYQAQGRHADAQRVLAQALALPLPNNGANLKTGTRLQYASILMSAKRYDQAATMYRQILNDETSNLAAWMGLVTAQHELNHDSEAIGLVEKIPPDAYDAGLADPNFLLMLGAIYQQNNQLEIAQSLLERSIRIQTKAGGQPSVALQTQLAGIYLQRNNTAQAYALYKQILQAHPDNLDAWRGLIGALQQTNRTSEALAQIKLIPPATRSQLETDVRFMQTEASLYAAAGDTVNALALYNRVQSYYQNLRQRPPAEVEIQNAWLLYNTKNDRVLYPTLMSLGARQDLTNAQRETIQTLWANWSVQRAATAYENGNTARAGDILTAALQAFPDNLTVRKAVAAGYLRIGKSKESLLLFKKIDLQDANAADFQGAIGSALAANDKAQAEQWLRQGLERYPRDSAILALAARFEQARGDNARAADYWRASIAAMPEVTPTDKLAHTLMTPEQVRRGPATPTDLANMLNPDRDPSVKSRNSGPLLPPLPSYGPDPYSPGAPVILTTPPPVPGSGTAPVTAPTYPAPSTTTAPIPVPQSDLNPSSQPASSGAATKPGTSKKAAQKKESASVNYSGRMQLPPGEDSVISTDSAPRTPSPAAPVYPQSANQSHRQPAAQPKNAASPTQASGLRLSSEPLNPVAAKAQALFIDETDGQLTQGLAAGQIRYVPNATTSGVALPSQVPAQQPPPAYATYNTAQYTPSAQDAAAGAYSAQKPSPAQSAQPPAPQPAPQTISQPKSTHKKSKPKPAPAPQTETVPTLETAPAQSTMPSPQLPVNEAPPQGTQSTTGGGLTDQELQDRNLPPLRGPWARLTHQQPTPVSPREEAETQLRMIEGGYSPWLGGTGNISHRTGNPGYDSLSALSSDLEGSIPIGTGARFTVIARPVFLDSGQANGNAIINITTGNVTAPGPAPIGTLTGAAASTTPPAQQNASGIGGEAQLTFGTFAVAGGYTPYGFLVSNWTARAIWRPGNGPFTFSFNRDSVKDSQLSYSGLRDPGSISAFFPGNIWGGVMADSGNIQYAHGDLNSGFYLGAGGQYLTGYHVQDNVRIDGSAGAYWRVLAMPEYGTLNVGANFFGMHYSHNLLAYTYGMGGYFSPQSYFLANIPLTWTGHYTARWHYTVLGSFGIQAFSEDSTPLAPLDLAIETEVFNGAKLAALTSVGPNYDLRGQFAYSISDHWFVGGFAGANNSRDYTSVNAGFSVRYLFRSQPSTVAGPTGLFLTDDAHPLRPLTVP